MATLPNPIKTRYLVVRLDITNEINPNTPLENVFSDGTTTKYIYGYSSPAIELLSNQGLTKQNGGFFDIVCTITAGVNWQDNNATIRISGIDDNDINIFSRANLTGVFDVYLANKVTVYAGYSLGSDNLPPLVYTGGVVFAGADKNVSRNRDFIIHSVQNFPLQNLNIPPTNINGIISVDNLFRHICNVGNLRYQGYNITGNAYNPIYKGDVYTQLTQATKQYGYAYSRTMDASQNLNLVYVAPIGQPLQARKTVLQIENNGFFGFPTIDIYGFNLTTYFNPALEVGQQLEVASDSCPTINNKNLYINQMVHQLGNRSDNWMSTLQLNEFLVTFTGTPS